MKGSFRGIYDAFDGFKKTMEEALDGAVDKDIPPGATVVTAKRPPPFLPFANPFLPGNQNAKTHVHSIFYSGSCRASFSESAEFRSISGFRRNTRQN